MNRIGELYQFAICLGDGPEFAFAWKEIDFYLDEVVGPLKKVLWELGDRPNYVTMDMDVVVVDTVVDTA